MDTQLKKGVLDLCILSHINEKESSYGYDIYQYVNSNLTISESTIYPILRKFVKEGYCNTKLVESNEGPARKYFFLTEEGKARLKYLKNNWNKFKYIIDSMI